jgi:hypothetical protein
MKEYLWSPSIDNWVIKENDASAFQFNNNFQFSSDLMAGGVPVKSENEEEEFDKLKQPYKGIKTLKNLKEQINQILDDIFTLSKTDKQNDGKNPYEKILNIIENPELKTMLEIASNEIKEKNLSSF